MFGFDANGYYGMSELISNNDETKPVVHLSVKRVQYTLFYTATHKVQIFVDDELIAESPEISIAMRDIEMRSWVCDQIKQNRFQLTSLDIDVRAEFVKFGGDANNLYGY